MTDKQLTTLLSPAQKLSNLASSIDEKVTMMYEMSVENLKKNETQVSELKQQTSILKDIKDLLKTQTKTSKKRGGGGAIGGLNKLSKDSIGIAAVAMVGISAAILATAGMFTLIPVISSAQLLTAIAISAAFIPMSIAFVNITKALSKVKSKKIKVGKFKLSGGLSSALQFAGTGIIAMIGMAAAVTASSYILSAIKPIGMAQVGTALFVGLAFVGLAYGYAEVVKALAGVKDKKTSAVNPGDVFTMVGGALIAMVGMAAAVTMSSWIMQGIMPVSMEQVGTAFFIGLAMVGMAYGYAEVVKALARVKEKKTGRVNTGDLFSMIGGALLSMIGMAAAVTVSSWIMQMIVPVSLDKLATAFAIGIVMIGAAFAYGLIAKATKKLKIKDLLMATAAIPLIAIGLTAAAWVFTFLPDDMKAPDYEWTGKAGLALLVFGLAFTALTYTVAKLPLKDMLFGVIGTAAVAIAILATAWIFSILPDNFIAPDMGWSLSAMVAIILFAIPVGVIGAIIMATGGTGLAAIALGVIGMIIIAAGILAVAWIFSYIPADKLAKVAKGLTEALLAPLNGIVNVLVRLKNEIGVDQLIPLAVGIIAISVSLMALAGATAGVAAGGLLSSVANVTTAFFDGIATFFGAEESKGPMDILQDLVTIGPEILVLSKGMDTLAASLGSTIGYLTTGNIKKINSGIKSVVLTDAEMMEANKFSVKKYFKAYPKFLNDVAKGYHAIVDAQSGMDVEVLEKTTEMVKALAYLNEIGGDNAMAKLGDALINAVKELSDMIGKFGGSVEAQTEAGNETANAIKNVVGSVEAQTEAGNETANAIKNVVGSLKGALGFGDSGSSNSAPPSTANINTSDIVEAIEELQNIIKKQRQFQ